MSNYSSHTPENLKSELATKREALRLFRNMSAGSRARNTQEGSTIRKEIARILTALSYSAILLKKSATTRTIVAIESKKS